MNHQFPEDGVRLDGKEGGLSDKTILHHHRLLSKIFNNALQWDLISINPVSKVTPPKVKKKEAVAYDDEQTIVLLQALEKEEFKYKVMVILDLFTGLRRGELMGLEWSDIDFDNYTVTVNRASQYLPEHGVFTKEPKTESSKRLLSIPEYIISLLKSYKAWQNRQRLKTGDLWIPSGRLFTKWNGEPMHPDTISQWFPKFIRRHDLPNITFHGLRHTNASLLIAEGIDCKTISTRLGHSSTTTTLNIYAHRLKKPDRKAADSLQNLLIKSSEEEASTQK